MFISFMSIVSVIQQICGVEFSFMKSDKSVLVSNLLHCHPIPRKSCILDSSSLFWMQLKTDLGGYFDFRNTQNSQINRSFLGPKLAEIQYWVI